MAEETFIEKVTRLALEKAEDPEGTSKPLGAKDINAKPTKDNNKEPLGGKKL